MLTKTDMIMLSLLGVLALPVYWLSAADSAEYPATVKVEVKPDTQIVDEIIVPEPLAKIPDFSTISDVQRKKQAFFNFMLPLVEAQNKELLALREKVQSLQQKAALTREKQKWLVQVAKRYKVAVPKKLDSLFFNRLLDRIDIIPASLALAQAANESAWGASRFAQQGNNLFGQWCFSKGCGLIPGGRPSGAKYEVQKFATVSDSVRAYMHNLNTHYQYERFRAIRATLRSKSEPVTGPILAEGLQAYSIRGMDYVDELIGMIASNSLVNFDVGGASSGI